MDARDKKPWFTTDENAMCIVFTRLVETTEGDEEIEVRLPAKFVTCHVCEGRGNVVNPNIDRHGLTREDFDEDPDFFEDYRRGVFDIACNWCGGKRVEMEIDEDRANPDDLAAFHQRERWEYEARREAQAEARMCGYEC